LLDYKDRIPNQNEPVNYQVIQSQNQIIMTRTGLTMPEGAGGLRGSIQGFSYASKKRLIEYFGRVDLEKWFFLFVTFTYPDEYPPPEDWKTWKRHWHYMKIRMYRDLGPIMAGGIWRLESQKRGAPHYHLALFLERKPGDLKGLKENLRKRWFDIVGSGDMKHLYQGVDVRKYEKKKNVVRKILYLAKYVGKDSMHPKSQVFNVPVGRHWGIWGKERICEEPETIAVSPDVFGRYKRIIKRKIRADVRRYGYKWRHMNKAPRKVHKSMPGLRCLMKKDDQKRLLDYLNLEEYLVAVPF
jgi:hypothetical protein